MKQNITGAIHADGFDFEADFLEFLQVQDLAAIENERRFLHYVVNALVIQILKMEHSLIVLQGVSKQTVHS